MKKIAFSEKYGLQDAVLERLKWMTRREVSQKAIIIDPITGEERVDMSQSPFKVGEIVAIAQRYSDLACTAYYDEEQLEYMTQSAGWKNKMFVKAELMPRHIKITDVRAERLQDISDEDCLKEGIKRDNIIGCYWYPCRYPMSISFYASSKRAFAALIDKISGKGTWIRNPWVWVYTFELVD